MDESRVGPNISLKPPGIPMVNGSSSNKSN